MIIVAGKIYVDEQARTSYLEECTEVIRLARQAPGCVDFHIAADPVEPDRINVYEQWDDVAAVEAFRGSGPSSHQQATIRETAVFQHDIATTQRL